METFVITLERTPGRLEAFTRNDAPHKDIVRFEAVDGLADEVASRLSRLKAATGLTYSAGAFGAAPSHEALWLRAAASGAPITACEDDAVLHADFAAESAKVLAFLGEDWDFVFWGWNLDAPLVAELHPRLCPTVMSYDQASLRLNWAGYVRAAVMPTVLRLRSAFGTPCYSISPKGARNFLSRCFPLKNFDWTIPLLNRRVANYGIDVAMCPAYKDTAALRASLPLPLPRTTRRLPRFRELSWAGRGRREPRERDVRVPFIRSIAITFAPASGWALARNRHVKLAHRRRLHSGTDPADRSCPSPQTGVSSSDS